MLSRRSFFSAPALLPPRAPVTRVNISSTHPSHLAPLAAHIESLLHLPPPLESISIGDHLSFQALRRYPAFELYFESHPGPEKLSIEFLA